MNALSIGPKRLVGRQYICASCRCRLSSAAGSRSRDRRFLHTESQTSHGSQTQLPPSLQTPQDATQTPSRHQQKQKLSKGSKKRASEAVKQLIAKTSVGNPSKEILDRTLGDEPAKAKKSNRSDLDSVVKSKAKGGNKRQGDKAHISRVDARGLKLHGLEVDQPPVPRLSHGLERVLFNPGVYQLQDPRSGVYNFDPALQKIMPVAEFDFGALKEYVTSSQDSALKNIALESGKRYMGSTSSMTGVVSHFHYLLSHWRPIGTDALSKQFPDTTKKFTELQRAPSAIFLRWKDGMYAIDADKQFASNSVLSLLGKSMEKLLTLNTDEYDRYRRSSEEQVPIEDQVQPESYHYTTFGDFMMRSQLDAYDPRLPGTGMFDLKTRATVSVRMDLKNYEQATGYQIKDRHGAYESYEREYYDMIRAALLKYSLQARMGRMDGIFVAYHNVERIFGFQYVSLEEIDSVIHGQWDKVLGDQEFLLSLELFNRMLNRATTRFPETSLRIFFETRDASTPFMYIFAEPVTEEEVDRIQSHNDEKVAEFERNILGYDSRRPAELEQIGEDGKTEGDSGWVDMDADVESTMDRDELGLGLDNESEDLGSVKVLDPDPPIEQAGESSIAQHDESEELEDGSGEVEQMVEQDVLDGQSEVADAVEDVAEDGHEFSEETATTEESLLQSEDLPPSESDTSAADSEASNTSSATAGDSDTLAESGTSITDSEASIASPLNSNDADLFNESDHKPPTSTSKTASSTSKGPTEDEGPLLAISLYLRNKVNGRYVPRPEKLRSAERWTVEYSMNEVGGDERGTKRAWTLYRGCQKRRQRKLDASMAEADAEANYYIRILRRMSQDGRRWRRKMDEKEKGRPTVVLGSEVRDADET